MKLVEYMMSFKILLFLFGGLMLIACQKKDDTPQSNNKVNIRLSNSSQVKFKDASFNGINFGDLKPGKTSDYKIVENAYHYGQVSIVIDEQTYGWQPIDYVGETPLEKGYYTFEYQFNEDSKTLTDSLIKD